MTTTYARCTRIDLDDEEMPAVLHLVLSEDVAERIALDFDVTTVTADPSGQRQTHLPIAEAADMGRHYGTTTGADAVGGEIYDCLANIANRFWDNGLADAPTAGPVAKSAEAAR